MKVLIAIENSQSVVKVTDAVVQHFWPENTEFLFLNAIDACRMPDSVLKRCRQLITGAVSELCERMPNFKVLGEVTEGDAREDIVAAAKHWGADLIILAGHTDCSIKRHGVSNSVISILNHAPCSVEVVKMQRNQVPEKQHDCSLPQSRIGPERSA